jgi:hypothetical protein
MEVDRERDHGESKTTMNRNITDGKILKCIKPK